MSTCICRNGIRLTCEVHGADAERLLAETTNRHRDAGYGATGYASDRQPISTAELNLFRNLAEKDGRPEVFGDDTIRLIDEIEQLRAQLARAQAAAHVYAERVEALGLAADDNDPAVMATAEPLGEAQADLWAELGLLERDASGKVVSKAPTESIAWLRAERDNARMLAFVRGEEIERLKTRRDELLATIVRISQETPLPEEVAEALNQRGALVAEVGTLRARVAELERQLKDEDGPYCLGCANLIDAETCYCGEDLTGARCDNHHPVPMGCVCLRAEPDWQELANARGKLIHKLRKTLGPASMPKFEQKEPSRG